MRNWRTPLAAVLTWAAALALVGTAAVLLAGDDFQGWQRSGSPDLPLTRGFVIVEAVLVAAYLVVNGPWLVGWTRRTVRALRESGPEGDLADEAAYAGLATVWRPRLAFVAMAAGSTVILGTSAWADQLDPRWWWVLVVVVVCRARPALVKWIAVLIPLLLVARALPVTSYHPSIWLVVAAGTLCLAAVGGLGVVTLGAKSMAGRTRYPTATSRSWVAIGNGVRRGAALAAWFLIALPVVALNYQFFAPRPDGDPSRLEQAVGLASVAIATTPILAATLLVLLPIGGLVLLDRWSARLVSVDASELRLAPDVPTTLYLRSWTADRVWFRTEGMRLGILENLSPPRRASLAELIGEATQWAAPVVATGEPGTRRLRGVGSMWSTDEEWRANVLANAANALCVVVTAGEVIRGSGYEWELDVLGAGAAGGRLVVVLPPGVTVAESLTEGGFLHRASKLPAFEALARSDFGPNTRVLARSGADGWEAFGSSDRSDVNYVLCIREAIDRFQGSWEDELLGKVDGMSSDRLVRDAAHAFGNNPWVRTLARLGAWAIQKGWLEKGLDAVADDVTGTTSGAEAPAGRAVDRYDDAAKRAVAHAQDAARERGDAVIGTEHLLLGLVRENSGPAVLALARCDVFPTDVTRAAAALLPAGGARIDSRLPVSRAAASAMERAGTEACRVGVADRVGVDHLLLSLADSASGASSRVLSSLGVTHERLSAG